MPGYRNIAGTWRPVVPWRNIGGVWKSGILWRNIGGVWKIVAGSVSAVASPSSVSGFNNANPVTGGPCVVTASNGSGNYSYSWSIAVDGPFGITIGSPSSASTVFTANMPSGGETSGTATCLVTDTSTGQTTSVSVPVYLSRS